MAWDENMEFANFFTEDVKKNHIFPQFLGYIAIHLVPVGGQLCVLGKYIFYWSLDYIKLSSN